MAQLNKKIICFMDEYGTIGQPGFALGCVVVWARECGKLDKAFSDLLPTSVNEVHAADWNPATVQGLLGKLTQTDTPASTIFLNKVCAPVTNELPQMYAEAVIDVTKTAVKRFRKLNRLSGRSIGNVELVVDACEQNTHELFEKTVRHASKNDGLFRSVIRVIPLDSAASRLLQLADVIAHSRAWINNGEQNAKGLRTAYGIEVL